MKNTLKCTILFVLALFLARTAFSQADLSKHEENIKKACMTDTRAWLDADLEAWAATHAKHENETLIFTNADGSFTSINGWETIYAAMKNYMSGRSKDTAKVSADNFKFIIAGDMAFVMYDQTLTPADGKIAKSREHRSMILKDGQWKIIAMMAFYDHTLTKKE